MDYEQQGRADGEAAGFKDGLDGRAIRPSPALAPTLASVVYLHAYTTAYQVSFVRGGEARETIMNWRANADAIHERNDEGRDRSDV